MDNKHKFWQQGYFIDSPKYASWSDDQKRSAMYSEKCLVRPSSTGNVICQCPTPEHAQWIASRLNIAAEFEAVISILYSIDHGINNPVDLVLIHNGIDRLRQELKDMPENGTNRYRLGRK